MNAIEKSVAELNISNAIKSGDTRNILRHIGSSWTGEPESFPRFTRSLEQAVSAIRALGESIADSCEDIEVENAAADQSEALAKGMLSAAKSAMLSEIEKIVSATYSCRD